MGPFPKYYHIYINLQLHELNFTKYFYLYAQCMYNLTLWININSYGNRVHYYSSLYTPSYDPSHDPSLHDRHPVY